MRRIKHNPLDSDFDSAQLKAMKKLRDVENAALLAVIAGETDILPDHTYVNLPGTTIIPYQAPHQAEVDFDAAVEEYRVDHRSNELGARNSLKRESGIVIPPGQISREWLEKYRPQIVGHWEKVTSAAEKSEDIFSLAETRHLLAFQWVLATYGLKISDVVSSLSA